MRLPLPPRLRSWGVLACRLALAALCFTLGLALSPRVARAEAPNARATPVHVLGIDSDDAEDQADALTLALRSRVRTAPGWSLQETQHTLGMLTAALRCPSRPDAQCLGRIGDQLHTDRFVWGVLAKSAGNQVTADIHLWARGKPDSAVKETYSDNLKDGNDETLRKIAQRIVDRLAGSVSVGTVTVHAGDVDGQVWINGQRKTALQRGSATVELAPGTYVVEVRSSGYLPAQQAGVTVAPGQDTSVALKLAAAPQADTEVQASAGKPTNVRRIVAWTLMGVGAVGLAVGGLEGVRFLSIKGDLDTDRNEIDKSITDVCAVDASTNPTAGDACSKLNDAKSARTIGLLSASAGAVAVAVGFVLLVTDHPKETGTGDAPQTASLRVLPTLSPHEAGMNLGLTF